MSDLLHDSHVPSWFRTRVKGNTPSFAEAAVKPPSLLRASGTQDQTLYMNQPPDGRTALLTEDLPWAVRPVRMKCMPHL